MMIIRSYFVDCHYNPRQVYGQALKKTVLKGGSIVHSREKITIW